MSKDLRRAAQRILFEDVWPRYGTQPMSHPTGQGGESVPPDGDGPIAFDNVDLPVAPTDLMPNRIAIEKPPIDDEEYYPNNPSALSSAMAAIGEEVPDSKVVDFYNLVKKGLEDIEVLSVEDEDEEEPTEEDEEEEADEAELESELVGTTGNMRTYENRIRKIIRNLLINEVYWGDAKTGSPRKDHSDLGREDEVEEEEIDDEEMDEDGNYIGHYQGNKREIKGKYVASYYGKSGDSGVTVGMQRLFANYLQHIGNVDESDLQDAQDYISYHFVELDPTFNNPEVLRVLRTYVFKKSVKDALKADQDVGNAFLSGVINYVKKLRKKDMETLLKRARAEVVDEKRADAEFVELLKREDPEQYSLFIDMFPSYAE
jgi:hypothetical protein